jgi:transposase
MRFYTKQHRYYCGIDLHARSMYVCILDPQGKILLHRNMPCAPELFLKAVAPYREDMAVAVECIFTWYWLADLCAKHNIPFVLGHALYMKAIHGGKAKNDKIDAHKIAVLPRGGMLPMAYVYPPQMRATRDLLRRRMYLMRKRSELLAHVQNTNSQYNLPEIGKKIAYKANRQGVAERFSDPSVHRSIEVDLKLMDHYDQLLTDLELYIVRTAKQHDAHALYRLRSVPGIGKILAHPLRDSRHQSLSYSPGLRLLFTLGQVRQRVGGKTTWNFGQKDRQCASEMGFLGSLGTFSQS